MSNCIICQIAGPQFDRQQLRPDLHNIDCDVCGRASYTMEVLLDIVSQSLPIYLLQGYTRYMTELDLKQDTITTDNLEVVLNHPCIPKMVPEKLDRLLLAIERKSAFGGDEVTLHYDKDFPLGFAKNQKELRYLVGELDRRGTIKALTDSGKQNTVWILSGGWNRIEQLKTQKGETNQCFVAMSFKEDMKPVYEKGIRLAIKDCGFDSYRIDRQEHTELIPFKMLAEIRKSRFVVADFTHHIRGVYFEAGFAMGLDIPVIWICRDDCFSETHFDIKQFNHIIYRNEQDLYEKLTTRIQAVIV